MKISQNMENNLIIGPYKLTQFLSSGSIGTVWECQNIITKELYACKILLLDVCLQDDFYSNLINELYIHSRIRHPSISEIHDIYVENNKIYIIYELCSEGDLNDIVQEFGGLSELQAKHYFFQLMSAIKYIHQFGIAHRDIKLENILITHDKNAKLTDFGLCKKSIDNSMMLTSCGSLAYAAPEIINEKPYNGMKADVWSSGIVLYAMICCHFPWTVQNDLSPEDIIQETIRQIIEGQVEIPDGITFELQNLLKNLLNNNPDLRPDADEIIQHPWFDGMEEIIDQKSLVPDGKVVSLVDSLIIELQKKKYGQI